MLSIKDILLKHKKPSTKILEINRLCAEILSKTLNTPIPSSYVSYHNKTLSLSLAPTLKTEILLQEEKIKEELKKQDVIVEKIQ